MIIASGCFYIYLLDLLNKQLSIQNENRKMMTVLMLISGHEICTKIYQLSKDLFSAFGINHI